MIRRRGRRSLKPCQVTNARQDFVDLIPADQAPAVIVREAWAALLPNQKIPLIGEERHGHEQDEC